MQLARLFLIPTFLDYLIHLKFIAYDMLLLCPFSQWGMVPEQQKSVQCGWRTCGWWLLNLLLTTFSQVAKRFLICKYISHYLPLALSHYIISSWFAKKPDNSYATHFYSLASPVECKSIRAFAQINMSHFVVRSRGERSSLQQGNDSQIGYLFFSYFNLFNPFCIFDDGI